MTAEQKNKTAIIVVVLLLLYFLFYYFVLRKQKETCPDGRSIPSSGNCGDNPVQIDNAGNTIVSTLPQPDASGCITPSSYITNSFPLALGMKGTLVKQVQIALNTNYGYRISEDGYFGCHTFAAVKSAYNVESIDAVLFKDKIQNTLTVPTGL